MKIERFLYVENNGCFEVTSHKVDRFGYPRCSVKGVNTCAHRVVFEHSIGPIPPGLLVRHTCDNPKCVNPAHLLLGTIQDNMADRNARGRTNKKVDWNIGERNPKTKLTENEVVQIRSLRGKLSQKKVAEKFNIGQTTVSGIQRGVYWKFLTGGVSFENI